jgi:glutamine amidotransferase PdxT
VNQRNYSYFRTIGILIEKHDLLDSLKEFAKNKPIWGVCAGAILLSNKI